MAESHTIIPPFPADVDREAFGHYLSGFVDGEGCFSLHVEEGGRRRPKAQFMIVLRADDSPILHQIQAFWGCGHFSLHENRGGVGKALQGRYRVHAWAHLAGVLVPHFDRFVLRAKKRRDYAVWREAVLLGHAVSQRPFRHEGHKGGRSSRWLPPEFARFVTLHDALRQVRRFESSVIETPAQQPEPPSLFDGFDADLLSRDEEHD